MRERHYVQPYVTDFGVSIHAPVRERLFLSDMAKMIAVSIHAPVRERLTDSPKSVIYGCFNSRSREGATA